MGYIEDPENGNVAAVDKNGHLQADAVTSVAEEGKATEGKAFIVHGECHTANASSGGFISIKNTSSTEDIYMTQIYIDAHSLTNPVIVTQWKNPTVSSGTDVSSTAMVNKNFGSVNTVDVEIKQSDASSDMTLSGGERFYSFALSSLENKQRNMQGTNVITPGKTWALGWKMESGNAVDGEVVSFSINIYTRPIGTII